MPDDEAGGPEEPGPKRRSSFFKQFMATLMMDDTWSTHGGFIGHWLSSTTDNHMLGRGTCHSSKLVAQQNAEEESELLQMRH